MDKSAKFVGGGSFVLAGIYWFFRETIRDMFFGWFGNKILSASSDGDMSGYWGFVFEYGVPITLVGFGLYFLFYRPGKIEPNMTMRDAFKYLMLDSKWSIGKKFNPFDNSGSSRSPNCQLYGQMTNDIEEAAKSGRIKVWVNNNVELEPLQWENLSIELTTCMGFGDSAIVLDHSVDPVEQLENTMINKHQFLSMWPRANCFQKLKDLDLYMFRRMFYQKEYQLKDG